jgi:colanic acid/amylovoran biosynthesis glycosyltransferase
MRIAYLVPEFPGQTHIFFWREIDALRQRGIEARLISSRHPPRKVISHSWTAVAKRRRYTSARRAPVMPSMPPSDFCDAGGWAGSSRRRRRFLPARSEKSNLAFLLCAVRLVGMMKRENPSHIHVHSCGDLRLVAAFANGLAACRYSLTLYGPLSDYGGQQKIKFRHAAFAVAIAKTLKAEQAGLGATRGRNVG